METNIYYNRKMTFIDNQIVIHFIYPSIQSIYNEET